MSEEGIVGISPENPTPENHFVEKLSGPQAIALINRLALRHPTLVKERKAFRSKVETLEYLKAALYATHESVVVQLCDENPKRAGSKGAQRFAKFSKDGIFASEYVALCAEMGFDRGHAIRDLRHDSRAGFIFIFPSA